MILAQIFRNFEVEAKFKMEEITPILDLVFNSEHGAIIKIKKRTLKTWNFPEAWKKLNCGIIFNFVNMNQLSCK